MHLTKHLLKKAAICSLLLLLLNAKNHAQTNWSLSGNSGTSSSNFLGTSDNQSLILKTNNNELARFSTNGNTIFYMDNSKGSKFSLQGTNIDFTTETMLSQSMSFNAPIVPNIGSGRNITTFNHQNQTFNFATNNHTGFGFYPHNAYTEITGGIYNAQKLKVDGNGALICVNSFQNAVATVPVVGDNKYLRFSNTGSLIVNATSENAVSSYIFDVNGTSKFSGNMNLEGALGIGTATPNENITVKYLLANGNNGGIAFRNVDNTDLLSLRTDAGASSTISSYYNLQLNARNNGYVYLVTDNQERLRVSTNGNIGINANNPTEKLEVVGNIKSDGLIIPTGASLGKVLTSDANGNATWQTAGNSSWSLSGTNLYNSNTGVIFVGTVPSVLPTDANLKLAVNGNVYAKKIKVTATGWADYVFASEYKLRPLKEVAAFIKKHHHLPEVPTAEEVKQTGIDIADTQVLLLKKIEELTLYIIEQDRKIEALMKGAKNIKNGQSN